jgi:nanoRNase/pAp phosphatase (c-di-AMP/oligoRNAs hydrolase)
MQIQAENFRLFSNLIEQSKEILILVDKDQSTDVLAAALFFKNLLSKLNKNTQVVSKRGLPQTLSQFTDKVSKELEPPKLVVSFNWHENAVDKVSYNLDEENFNFIVVPRNAKISEDEIKISQKGKDADLVIMLGVSSLSSLGDYEKDFVRERTIVNIDNDPNNQMFGRLNIVNEAADSVCGLVANLVEKSRFTPNPESADLLLLGIREATDNFLQVNNPSTFEAAAFCTKAKKGQVEYRETKKYKVKAQVPNDWLSPKVFRSKQQAS